MKIINQCDDCVFAKIDSESVNNAFCPKNSTFKVIEENGYINSCSSHKSKNLIKRLITFLILD